MIVNQIKFSIRFILANLFCIVALFLAVFKHSTRGSRLSHRLLWASTPIISFSYWSNAMRKVGYRSTTFVTHALHINQRSDWDRVLREEYRFVWRPLKELVAICDIILNYDVVFTSCDGFFVQNWPLKYSIWKIVKLSGVKIVVLPYGSDAYDYSKIFSVETAHGLMMSYPQQSREQERISRNVKFWLKNSDAFVPGFMGLDGFGRWDVLLPSPISINEDIWKTSKRKNDFDGVNGTVVIAHSPNHRGFKGTEFIVDAVSALRNEGLKVDLTIIEGKKNYEVKEILEKDVDILAEQLLFSGYALSGIEGMASGLPVLSNLDNDIHLNIFRTWSFLHECPIVSACPETITDVLRKLVKYPELRYQLGKAGRAYVEKYHSNQASAYLFENIINHIFGEEVDLINLYHPILGEYPNRSPKIQHPLVNSRIVEK